MDKVLISLKHLGSAVPGTAFTVWFNIFGLNTSKCLWPMEHSASFLILYYGGFFMTIIVYKSETIFSIKARKNMQFYGCSFQELNLEVVLFHFIPGQ